MVEIVKTKRRSIPGCCPACGQAVNPDQIVMVDAEGIVVRDNVPARITPQQTLLMRMLMNAYPGAIHRDQLILRLWDGNEPVAVKTSLMIRISYLRRAVAPLGISIVNRHGGFYMIRIEPAVAEAA